MKINIVTVTSGWILQKIAERTAAGNVNPDIEMVVSHQPDMNADVNYYVDLQNCYPGIKTNFDIAYLTHADQNSADWLIGAMNERNAWQLDGIVSMNKRYTDMLEDIGFSSDKTITITPGETKDMFPLKPITIGIVSRGGYPGYGQQFMEQFLSTYDFKNIRLAFLGDGWDALRPIANNRGIKLAFISDADYSVYPQFYNQIDYLLIPGLWTAGPMSMQEALSTGVPVIGADVGFVNYEFQADYTFEPGNVNQLASILDEIQKPRLARRAQVEHMTWAQYGQDVIDFILKLKENKND